MSRFPHHLKELSAVRNQDALDEALAAALIEMFDVRSLSVLEVVGEPGDRRWRSRFERGGTVTTVSSWATPQDLKLLPSVLETPSRSRALNGVIVSSLDGGGCTTVFPFAKGREEAGVVEVRTHGSIGEEATSMMETLLAVYCNLQGLLDYSQRDSLTGLLNRKTFDDRFFKARPSSPEICDATLSSERRAQAASERYWVGMIDIDCFKRVNDRFGHLIGDEVLLLIAQVMRQSCRAQDLVYRFGGEEFVALIQCSNEADSARVFERLRRGVEKCSLPQVGNVTVSIGFTELRAGDSPTSALGRADRAVYYAKSNGRNQVRSHAALAESGTLEHTEQTGEVELF